MIIIGISGVAGSGKDTLYKCIDNISKQTKYKVARVSFADEVIKEVGDFIKTFYNIDFRNCSREDKNKVRKFVVFYANYKRFITNGTYWINKVNSKLKKYKNRKNLLVCITDLRYANEIEFIKNNYDNITIHITRFIKNKSLKAKDIPERANDHLVKKACVYKYNIRTLIDSEKIASQILKDIISVNKD